MEQITIGIKTITPDFLVQEVDGVEERGEPIFIIEFTPVIITKEELTYLLEQQKDHKLTLLVKG